MISVNTIGAKYIGSLGRIALYNCLASAMRCVIAPRSGHRYSSLEFPVSHPLRNDDGRPGLRQYGSDQTFQRNTDHCRRLCGNAARSRFSPELFCFLTGSGGAIGDVLVAHPKTRFIAFTGSRDVGLHINELAAKPQNGQIWIKRVVAEMGGKDAIIVDAECDLEAAVEGVAVSAFGYQGQKCSACSRAIVDAAVYDEFLEKLKRRVESIQVGPPEDPANYMGPVISAGAKKSIAQYIEIGRKEGRLLTGGAADRAGHFIPPTVIADVDSKARIFQERFRSCAGRRQSSRFRPCAGDGERFPVRAYRGRLFRQPRAHQRAREEFFVGNMYVNRKCTGAMVGAHPFGGFNMSGTDSKAGGPDYLLLFFQAKSIAERISAEDLSDSDNIRFTPMRRGLRNTNNRVKPDRHGADHKRPLP